ncbi:MAG TPA: tetratricopeptide repeat protein [Thermomicrobiales bacterium]|nr:tetratricopeptide repeat protein [Thermomicrobiales bacterium]
MAKRKRGGGTGRLGGGRRLDAEGQEAVNQAVAMLEQGNFLDTVFLLEDLRQDYPREAVIDKLLGMAYAELGVFNTATERWEEASQLDPDDLSLLPLLARAYGAQGYYMHALRALRRYLAADLAVDDEDAAQLATAREQLEQVVAETSRELGAPAREVERGTLLLERALRAGDEGDFVAVMRLARDAARVLPDWPAPQNTLANAQFQLGKADEAIAIAERVLAGHPDDLVARANLVRFHLALGRRDEAHAGGDRLWDHLRAELATRAPGEAAADGAERFDPFALERAAESFALLQQDDRVVAALEPLPRESASELGLFLLGAALANLRRKAEALELFRALAPHPRAERVVEALELSETPPGGRFVVLAPGEILPGPIMNRALEPFLRARQESKEAGVAAARDLLQRAPTLLPALAAMLWLADEVSSSRAVDTLLELGVPETIDAVRGFAFGRLGPDDTRLYAALRLREAGQIAPGKGLLLWLDGRYEEANPPRYELTGADEADQPPYPPAVRKQMEKALERHEEGDLEGAARLYRQALALDPTIADAEQHLGVIALMEDDREAAERHFARAFELDPESALARCTLASLRLGQRRLDQARDLLVPLASRTSFEPGGLASYLFTAAELAEAEGDSARARRQLRLLLAYLPDHVPARLRLRELEQAEAERRQAATQRAVQLQQPAAGKLWTAGQP